MNKDLLPSAVDPTVFDEAFLRQLERLMLVTKKAVRGGMKGVRRSVKRGQSVEFTDYRDYTLGDDLRYLPKLLVDRSVWLPILLTVAAGIAFAVTEGGNALVAIVATYFVAPPALGSVFIGGFLAPRASCLVGLIVGFVSAVVASIIILTSSASLVSGQPIVTTPSPTPAGSVDSSPCPSTRCPTCCTESRGPSRRAST